jgi:hypothetical protein
MLSAKSPAPQQRSTFAYDLIDTRVSTSARWTATSRIIFTESAEGRSQAKVITDAGGDHQRCRRHPGRVRPGGGPPALGHKLSGQFP